MASAGGYQQSNFEVPDFDDAVVGSSDHAIVNVIDCDTVNGFSMASERFDVLQTFVDGRTDAVNQLSVS